MVNRKVFYFTTQPFADNNGVTQKVISQVQAINKIIGPVSVMSTMDGCNYMINNNISLGKYGHSELLFQSGLYDKILNFVKKEGINIIYVRYVFNSCKPFVSFLMRCKQIGCYVILEIPTFPYDSEMKSLKERVLLCLEKYYRQKLHNYVDRIVTYTSKEKIYNIKTISISNAPAIIPPLYKHAVCEDTFTMIAVANINFWHGYDRLIKGMAEFLKGQNTVSIKLYVVGNGNFQVENNLRSLVNELGMTDYVVFTGGMSGPPLDDLFNKTDLAIGCLACHRKNVLEVKSLKNVEYAMRGIPFVYSEINPDFEGKEYVLKIPADESFVDINRLITFRRNCKLSAEDIRSSVSSLTWEAQIKKIEACIR